MLMAEYYIAKHAWHSGDTFIQKAYVLASNLLGLYKLW